MDTRNSLRWWNGPLDTPENASLVLKDLGRIWWGVAGLTILLAVVQSVTSPWPWTGLILDAVLCALAGYLLPRRRSRFFAVLLLAYALSWAVAAVPAPHRWTSYAVAWIAFAGVLIAVAIRGTLATLAYRRLVGSRPVWRNVAIGLVVCGVLGLGGFLALSVGAGVFEEVTGLAPNDQALGVLLYAIVMGPIATYYFLLRDRLPWATEPVRSTEWPQPSV